MGEKQYKELSLPYLQKLMVQTMEKRRREAEAARRYAAIVEVAHMSHCPNCQVAAGEWCNYDTCDTIERAIYALQNFANGG